VGLEVEHLHRWLGHRLIESVQAADGNSAFRLPDHKECAFAISPGITLRILQNSAFSWNRNEEYKVMPNCGVWLLFEEPRSLEEITEQWAPWVTRFFSLLMGTGVRCLSISFSQFDPNQDGLEWAQNEGNVLGRSSGAKRTRLSDPNPLNILAPFSQVESQLGTILQRWYDISNRFEPVVSLFSAVVFNHSLYMEAQFLFLIQALEVYHTRASQFSSRQLPPEEHALRVEAIVSSSPDELKEWVRRKLQSANYKYLNEKLLDIFYANETEARRLFGNIDQLADRIAYTRNHLTHYNNDSDSERFLGSTEMVAVNFSLEDFIWILLLRELGVSGVPIERLIQRNESAVHVHLSARR
jgi:hypothetical protein